MPLRSKPAAIQQYEHEPDTLQRSVGEEDHRSGNRGERRSQRQRRCGAQATALRAARRASPRAGVMHDPGEMRPDERRGHGRERRVRRVDRALAAPREPRDELLVSDSRRGRFEIVRSPRDHAFGWMVHDRPNVPRKEARAPRPATEPRLEHRRGDTLAQAAPATARASA